MAQADLVDSGVPGSKTVSERCSLRCVVRPGVKQGFEGLCGMDNWL